MINNIIFPIESYLFGVYIFKIVYTYNYNIYIYIYIYICICLFCFLCVFIWMYISIVLNKITLIINKTR